MPESTPSLSDDPGIGWQVIKMNGHDLADDSIEDLVNLSLGTDRRASADDVLPGSVTPPLGPSSMLRGFWADPGFGSRLWLLSRVKITSKTLRQAETYAVEALEWLVSHGIAASVTATARRDGVIALISVGVVMPDGAAVTVRYPHVWS